MNDLIYNQKKIPKGQWRYGLRASAATGCGWIAVYNGLKLMGYHVDIEKLVRCFTWQFPLINGNMGTFLPGPALFFRKKGFSVKLSLRPKKFDCIGKGCDVCILFYYWHRKWKFGAHFVAVQYQDGKFVGYNTFSNSVGPDVYGESLKIFLKNQRYSFPVLMGIKDIKRQ